MDLIGLEGELKQSGDCMSGTKHRANCVIKGTKVGTAICSIFLSRIWTFCHNYLVVQCNFPKTCMNEHE